MLKVFQAENCLFFRKLWPQHKTCTFRLLCTKDLDCYIRSHGFLTLAKKKLVVPWEHLLVAKNFSLVGGKEQKNEDDPIVSGQWHIGLGLQPNLKSQKFFLMSDWKFQILQFLPFPRNTKSLHIWSQKRDKEKMLAKQACTQSWKLTKLYWFLRTLTGCPSKFWHKVHSSERLPNLTT